MEQAVELPALFFAQTTIAGQQPAAAEMAGRAQKKTSPHGEVRTRLRRDGGDPKGLASRWVAQHSISGTLENKKLVRKTDW